MLEHQILATIIRVVSGPGGVASFLRRNLLGRGLNGPSLPLDVGQSDDIPVHLRRLVALRDQGCQFPGGCDQPAAGCEPHHITRGCHGLRKTLRARIPPFPTAPMPGIGPWPSTARAASRRSSPETAVSADEPYCRAPGSGLAPPGVTWHPMARPAIGSMLVTRGENPGSFGLKERLRRAAGRTVSRRTGRGRPMPLTKLDCSRFGSPAEEYLEVCRGGRGQHRRGCRGWRPARRRGGIPRIR